MAIDNADLKQIKDLASAGTPATDMHFPVQQDSVDDIAQQITLAEFTEAAEMTGQATSGTNKVVTPNAFSDTNATETRFGTIQLATSAEIAAKTSAVANAIEVDKIDDLFLAGIPSGTLIPGTDFDGATEGTASAISLYSSTYGNRATIEGTFTFTPNVSTDTVDIYINNNRQPAFANSDGGFLVKSSAPTELYPIAATIESNGADTDGIGQIKITIGRGSTAFVNGDGYLLGLNINYLAKF